MTANNSWENAALKKNILETARYISENCEFDYHSYKTEDCKRKMKELQADWKKIGSAGNYEKGLWNQFKLIQDIFWTKNRLMNIDMKILEMSDESADLHEDFEIAYSAGKSEKADRLYEAYERKEDKITDLMYDKEQLKQELYILQGRVAINKRRAKELASPRNRPHPHL